MSKKTCIRARRLSATVLYHGAGIILAAAALPGCGTTSSNPVANKEPTDSVATNANTQQTPATAQIGATNQTPGASMTTAQTETATPTSLAMIGATTNLRRVTFAEEGADFDPSISADGTRLVFASTQHRPTSDIYIKSTDSRVVTQLTNDPADDAMPALSPDGSKIAFASNRSGNWDLYVMPATGGKAVQVTSDSADEVQPSWSPDGTQLVFARAGASSGRWELWVTSLQSTATPSFIGFGMHPRWCPVAGTGVEGSDKILFQLGRERGRRSFGVWTLDYASGGASNLTEIAGSATTALINPTWSPDGHWIAFAETPVTEAPATSTPAAASLWMVGVEGEGRVRLTSDTAASFSPVWTKSGRIYFASNMSGSQNIWSVDAAGAVAAAMTTLPAATPATASATHETPHDAVANVPEAGQAHEQH